MTRADSIWLAIVALTALGVTFLAGYESGKRGADKWWENFLVTASPFAPSRLTSVTRFVIEEGTTLNCVFDNEGNRGDLVIWDGEYVGKNGAPSKTCHAIHARIIGELIMDTPAWATGKVQFYEDRKEYVARP
jgi:hypothetical protein